MNNSKVGCKYRILEEFGNFYIQREKIWFIHEKRPFRRPVTNEYREWHTVSDKDVFSGMRLFNLMDSATMVPAYTAKSLKEAKAKVAGFKKGIIIHECE